MPFLSRTINLSIILIVIALFGCASPKPLEGGPKDITPPEIIEDQSTPNQQTNFTGDEIVLTFNEWVALSDVYSQLVISPLLPKNPEIRQKGKSVIITLPDSLRDNTTYTINFGNAITDLNEGNVLENYVFVFSTGPVLDSISIAGSVIDAVTLKAADDIWVMLYNVGEDSAVYKRKPDYIARTNETGKWSISFLPVDSFNVVALKDDNSNFLYDQESEYFGWLDQTVFTGNQEGELPPIFIFPKEHRTIVKEVIHPVPGWMKIVIEAPPPKPMPTFLPALDSTITLWEGDTLHIWYNPERNYSGFVTLEGDSTQLRSSSQPSMVRQPILIKALSGRIKPGGTAVFSLNVPIVEIDRSKIISQHDSLGVIPLVIERDSIDIRKFRVSGPWQGQNRYPVVFLPGAIRDFWGRTNDTIRQSVTVSGPEQFGDLFITIDSLDKTKQYVILLKEGDKIIDTFVAEGVNHIRIEKRGLSPAKYAIEIVEDINRNKIWDTGSYERRRQPERKMLFNPEGLRAGWEQEVKLTWK